MALPLVLALTMLSKQMVDECTSAVVIRLPLDVVAFAAVPTVTVAAPVATVVVYITARVTKTGPPSGGVQAATLPPPVAVVAVSGTTAKLAPVRAHCGACAVATLVHSLRPV